jgi:hypothetical protein
MGQEEDGWTDFLFNSWVGQLVLSAVLLVLAWLCFFYPDDMRSIHWTIVLLYATVGRWGMALFLAIPALIALYAGIHNLTLRIRGDDR